MIYDYQNCIDYAKEKGLAEGEAKGRAEGLAEGLSKGEAKGKIEGGKLAKIETARNLLKENAPTDMICRVTGLTEKDIESLLHR